MAPIMDPVAFRRYLEEKIDFMDLELAATEAQVLVDYINKRRGEQMAIHEQATNETVPLSDAQTNAGKVFDQLPKRDEGGMR